MLLCKQAYWFTVQPLDLPRIVRYQLFIKEIIPYIQLCFWNNFHSCFNFQDINRVLNGQDPPSLLKEIYLINTSFINFFVVYLINYNFFQQFCFVLFFKKHNGNMFMFVYASLNHVNAIGYRYYCLNHMKQVFTLLFFSVEDIS